MGNDQSALCALFACELGLLELEIGLEHVFVLLTFDFAKKHDKWQNSHGARLQEQLQTAIILSVTFIDLILESASTSFDLFLLFFILIFL